MKHKLSTRVLSMLMAIIMMLSLTTSVFAADSPASAEPEVLVEPESEQNSPAPSVSPASGDDPSRLTTIYEGHRIHYIDSKKKPLPKNAELFMNEINEDDVPFYLQRAAHSLGLESCDMYLYFIADPMLEDASTAEILKYEANPDDPEDRMTVVITLLDDAKMTDEEKAHRLEELQNIHLDDLQVIQLGAYWDYDTILPHTEENGVIRFEIEKIAPFILFIPDWESAVPIPEKPESTDVQEEVAAPTEDTGTQQAAEPVEQPAEPTPAPDGIQNPESASDEEPIEEAYEQTVTASGSDYSVSLTYTADANIPEGSMFELSEIPASGILYDTLTTSVANALNADAEEISSVTFLDVDVKKDGGSVPLDAPVNVSIAVDDPADSDMVTQVVALGQQNEVLNTEGGTGTYSSTTDSLSSTYAIVRITRQATLKTDDDQNYLITVTYDRDDPNIPIDVELSVKELKEGDPGYDEYIAASAAVTGADRENIAFAKAFDICLIDPATGLECQPTKEVSVSIQLLEEEVSDSAPVDVIHFGEEESPKQLDAALNAENAIEFATPEFSVFVIMQVIKEQILTASDGQSYKVTVTYDPDSGIPEDAELSVSELKEGDAGYADYVAMAADKLGTTPENLVFARPFDITLQNPQTGERYQPNSSVKVSVRLMDEDLTAAEEVKVLHFAGDTAGEPELMDATVNGETVVFETDGFSVYVLIGSNGEVVTPLYTFKFFVPSEDVEGGYTEYILRDKDGNLVTSQSVAHSSELIVPQMPSDETKVFAGWYEGTIDGTGHIILEESPYDFDSIDVKPETLIQDTKIDLYAVYTIYATVIFHGQYDSESGSFPVAYTRRAELKEEAGSVSAKVKISDLSVAYTSSGGAEMAFSGWSETPISTPGAAKDDDDQDVVPVVPDADGCITVTGIKHLYPIFREIHWLTYYAAQSGLSAAYVPPVQCYDGEAVGSVLPMTSRPGYHFMGWYTGSLRIDGDVEIVTYSTQITNSDGTLVDSADDGGVYIFGGQLYLRTDATLYAKWQATYSIVYWKQLTTETPDAAEKHYEYAETASKSAEIGTTVKVEEADRADGRYEGYHLGHYDDTSTVIGNTKELTVLNVYYDLSAAYTPSGDAHKLTFADSVTGEGAAAMPDAVTGLGYQAHLKDHIPSDPVSGRKSDTGKEIYTFSGWYMDQACTIMADLSSMLMPDADLTVYAGWEPIKFKVDIDPNYGALYAEENGAGTGATYFNNTYDAEPIGEYTHVTRDYVESSSGTWFYVKHDRAYGGDRHTYYTQNQGLATEDTTFEYAPGAYTYIGWYEVKNGVVEPEPYDFTQHTDHDTTLRLLWKKNDVYYLAYDAKDGTLDDIGNKTVVLPDGYADFAKITLNQSALPQQGYTFVGWQVRGSESNVIYAPGQVFTLHADDAKRSGGKDIVFLDAVYVQVGTASIIYDANGGTIAESGVDFGKVPGTGPDPWVPVPNSNIDVETATVFGLTNNSRFKLSTGTGFIVPADSDAAFLGWSDKAVCDESATFYDKKYSEVESPVTYGISETNKLYAVWGVPVTYHLNSSKADWGAEWDPEVYTKDSVNNTFFQTVKRGNAISEPENVPIYTEQPEQVFRYWATRTGSGTDDDPYNYTPYVFSQPVTGALDLYAYWEDPNFVKVHAVDASDEELVDKADDTNWTVTDVAVSATETDLIAPSNVTPPEGENYEFAFVAASKGLDSVSESNVVTAIKYENKKNWVKYAGESTFKELETDCELYFVFYQKKKLNIGYKSMDASGALTGVTTTDDAPKTTGNTLLGSYDMSNTLTAPLTYTEGFSYYAFAVGSVDTGSDMNASNLSLITDAAGQADPVPTLRIRNTWRGFEYTTGSGDDASWTNCGYDPQLYVIYYTQQPTVILFREETVGSSSIMDTAFIYNVTVTQTIENGSEVTTTIVFDTTPESAGAAYHKEPYTLMNGEEQSAILFYSAPEGGPITTQTITITQTLNDDFSTTVNSQSGTATQPNIWTYTSNADTHATQTVTFTNTHKSLPVEVHVAMVTSGGIIQDDNSRTEKPDKYKFELAIDSTEELTTKLPSAGVFTGDAATYAFGAVLVGTGSEGSAVTVKNTDVASVSYEKIEDNIYELVLRDDGGNIIDELGSDQLYYLYYPMPQIRYVKEGANENLTDIKGFLDNGETSQYVTYSHALLEMNGKTVEQRQKFKVPLDGLTISQSGNSFRMPAVLDDGEFERYLSYAKLGVGTGDAANVSDLDISPDLTMQLRIQNNSLQYSFDGTTWDALSLASTPTIYAIYTERGYDLQISKTIYMSESGEKPIFSDKSFTVTISSMAITKNSYEADGAESETISATPTDLDIPGTITLTVVDGTKIRIKGLGQGDYTVVESENENYILTAKKGPIVGGTTEDVPVTDNTTISFGLDSETKLDLTNSPKAICRIGYVNFYTLQSMIDYVEEFIASKTAEAEMLTDYQMPAADTLTVPEGFDITLTTADSLGHVALITRTTELAGVPLMTNNGTLTLNNLILEGNNVDAAAPMIQSAGNLTVGRGAVIQNAVNTGNGGAISAAAGDITISGKIDNCSAAAGGAIYHSGNGTITINGTDRTDQVLNGNRATSGDGGAIYLAGGTVYVTGSSRISSNSAESGRGGAIYVGNAVIEIDQACAMTGNTAEKGGAIYAETAEITISKTLVDYDPAITGNAASVDNGGAIYVGAGSVTVSGGSVSNNTALSGQGGAIYTDTASVTVSGAAVINNNNAKAGGAVCTASGAVTVSGGTIQNNMASDSDMGGGAIYAGSGNVTLSGGSLSGNNSTAGSGGAVYANSGNVEVTGGSLTGNTAKTDGGAIYAARGTVSLSVPAGGTAPTVSGNTTTSGNGGAICADAGAVSLTGMTLTGNHAGAAGGAVYAKTGAVSSVNSIFGGNDENDGNTAGTSGGAIYADSGNVTVSGGSMTGNTATSGNGGAVYAGSGVVDVSGDTVFTGNTAADGNGGAMYADSGSVTLTAAAMSGNSAQNGAACFVNTGRATFSAGSYTGNTASAGGAIGVGNVTARLFFTGNVQVSGNSLSTATDVPKTSNVYLDQDDDAVIIIDALGGSADIGIYVPDAIVDTRSVPGARFAVYTSNSNVDKIINDRYPALNVQSDTAAKKLYWGNSIKVNVHSLVSYGSDFSQPANAGAGTQLGKYDTYYPEFSEAALSELGSELVVKNKLDIGTKVYAAAYLDGVRRFGDYITELHWDKDTSEWYVTTRAGETVFLKKTDGTGYHRIYIYYAEPAYLSIENNTDMALTISGMTVEGISVINSDTVAGYGMVFAKNGAIRSALLPVTAEDLELEAGQSISLLIPGGQNKPYTLDGSFKTTEGGSIRLRRGAESSLSEESVNLNPSGSFEQLTGSTLTTAGTYMIIFGDDKMICKVVDAEGTEHPYSRISAALAAIVATTGTNPPYTLATPKTATIEMLTDYLLTASDDVNIPQGFDITLTTAAKTGATYCYDGTGDRATISRDTQNTDSMIKGWNSLANNKVVTTLRLNNLIFDGKSVRGASDGGAVATQYVNVYIDTVDFKNVYASNGGALLVMFNFDRVTTKNTRHTVADTILEVKNSDFTGCTSTTTVTSNRLGGGAIVTNAETMTLEGCDFTNCTAVDQAGAVFHRIDFNDNSWTNVTDCTFTNCSADAAGGLEIDSKTITVTGCTFEHCVAKKRNGGGFNVWALNVQNGLPTEDCWVTVRGCTFNDCQLTTTDTSRGNGGGFRSNAVYNTIEDCTFTNNTAIYGGGISLSNTNAKADIIRGCSFERCTATGNGGGVYSRAKALTIEDYISGDITRHTEVKNCSSKNDGAGIYANNTNSTTTFAMTNATISGNRTTASGKNGGGVYTNARTVTISGSTITDNTCTSLGGGVYANTYTSLSIADSDISRNIASSNGGGVWFDYNDNNVRNNQKLTIKGSTIDGNTSNGNGGGVYTLAKTVTIGASETKTDSAGKPIRSSVSNNSATTDGGGIYQDRNAVGSELTISNTSINGNTSNNTNTGTDHGGGGIHARVRTLVVSDSTISNNTAKSNGGGILFEINNDTARDAMSLTIEGCKLENNTSNENGGGIYTKAKSVVIRAASKGEGDAAVTTRTTISNCTAAKNGGGIYQNRDVDGSSLTISGTDVKNNKANGTGNSELGGGGVYANVRNMTLTDSTVIGNTAVKHGGGIYKNSAGNDRYLIIEDHSLVKNNTAGNQGGGIYDRSQLWLRNNVEISGNRLTTNTAANCAGVYLENNRTLYVGPEDATENTTDTIIVNNNTTTNGTLSDLRLWEDSGQNKNTSVYVYCSLSEDSEIRVVNAAKVGTWFGSSKFANPAGFSDDQNVFKADASTLYGIIDRNEESGTRIIWAGPPIAKITYVDEYGNDNILFLKPDGTYPAIFDRLGTGSTDQSPAAAFNMLCTTTPALYKADGTLYEGNAYCIKMLDNFETPAYMYVQNVPGRTITFTTAGKDKDKEDGYPFKGSGTRATVTRSSSVAVDKSTLDARGNLILENIVLDGGSQSGVTIGASTRCMWVESGSNAVVVLGENALLQNGTSNGKGGGGVYIQSGTLNIQGGIIRNCTANNGGGVFINNGALTLSAGNIFQCTATGNGGGVYESNGSFTMSGGTISNGSAASGAGVYVANNKTFNMFGGSIINNQANTGGGIAIGGDKTRLNFSGKVTVSGNTATKEGSVVACNVELNQNSKAVINTNNGGLLPGGYIGVYVPGTRDDNNPGNDADPYKTRGGENDAFGTFAVGVDPNHNTNSDNLYCFVNDRNGLRGGIKKLNPDPYTIYWVKSFSIQVTKTVVSGGSTTVENDEQFLFKVNIRGQDETGQIKAKDMNGQYGDMLFVSNGTDTATAVFALTNGNTVTGVNFGEGLDYEVIEYLIVSSDPLIDQQKRYAAMPMHDYSLAHHTLTVDGTAYTVVQANVHTGKVGENINATDGTDPYASAVEFRNLMPVCKITDKDGNLLYQEYTWNKKTFYAPAVYTELTGDDGALKALEGDLYSSNGSNPTVYPVSNSNGVQIKMLISDYALYAPAEVKTDKVTLTTAANSDTLFPRQDSLMTPAVISRAFENISTVEEDSMFIVTMNGDVNGDLTLASITLDGRKDSYLAYANGGIVQVQNGGRLTIMDDATLQESKTAEGFFGGAVYVAQGGFVTVTGGSIIRNESVGDGAGIYLAEGSTLNLSGNPYFGGSGIDVAGYIIEKDKSDGNFKSGDLTLKFNGGKQYINARQDIFIAGYEGNDSDTTANSLIVTGNITSGEGTIWVWAEKQPRYKTLEQFAKYTAGVADPVLTVAAFRNAQPDDLTGESQVGEYLHGTTKPDSDGNVFWHGIEGSAHVMLVKVLQSGQTYKALSGRSFTVYTDSGMNSIANGTQLDDNGEEKTISLEGLSSGAGGAFFIGELAYGKYYVKETDVSGHFEFAVNENGVITIEDYDGNTEDPDPLKEVRLVG